MKKLLLLALGAVFCFDLAAQSAAPDSVAASGVSSAVQSFSPKFGQVNPMFDVLQSFTSADDSRQAEQTYPLGEGLFKKTLIVQAIEICPNISKSKISESEKLPGQNVDEINDTGVGLNFGYSVVFVPGKEDNGQLRLNKAGFAYSIGFLASFSQSDRYGTTCDFMGKIGLETCFNRRMGIGFDLLGGYGKSSGDMFFYKNIVEDTEPSSVVPYTLWGWKYGGQLWLKTGVFSKIDVILVARLIYAADPGKLKEASLYTFNLYRKENWGFGIIVRYRI